MDELNLSISEGQQTAQQKSPKKAIWITIAVIGFIGIFILIFSSISQSQPKNQIEISECSISSSYSSYLGYSASVVGKAKNISGKNLSYVQLEFSLYDAAGNNLGTALANINNLSSGDTWNFEATLFSFPSTQPVSYKLVSITTW